MIVASIVVSMKWIRRNVMKQENNVMLETGRADLSILVIYFVLILSKTLEILEYIP